MKKSFKKLKDMLQVGARFFVVGVVAMGLGVFSVIAATNFDSGSGWNVTVSDGDSLTSSMWNNLTSQVSHLTNNLTGIVHLAGLNIDGNVGIGTTSPSGKLHVNGRIVQTGLGKSVFIGESAGIKDDGTDNYNIAIGANSLKNNTIGSSNAAIGGGALFSNINGNNNLAIGDSTLFSNEDGNNNTAIGKSSLQNNVSGIMNLAIGPFPLRNNKYGSYNSAIGSKALYNNEDGSNNLAIGVNTLYSNTNGNGNVTLGYESGYNTSGSKNIFIGYQAGYNESGSDKLYIDNSNTSNPLIYGDFDSDNIVINGGLEVKGDFTYPSDIRLKENITPINLSLEKINQLNGYTFDWKKNGTKDIGVIAQEVEEVFPELVKTDSDGMKSVKYANLVAPIVEAIKDLTKKVEDLYVKYLDQQAQIDDQQRQIDELRSIIQAER